MIAPSNIGHIRPDRKPTLGELVQSAVSAHERCAQLEATASDDAWNYHDRQAVYARDVLFDALAELGITRALASRMAVVL